jgi:hypothetical protein
MNLYFLSSRGEKRLVRENIDPEMAMGYINEYIATLNPNFKVYYVRTWESEEGTMYDVGSHTEFFLVGTEKI